MGVGRTAVVASGALHEMAKAGIALPSALWVSQAIDWEMEKVPKAERQSMQPPERAAPLWHVSAKSGVGEAGCSRMGAWRSVDPNDQHVLRLASFKCDLSRAPVR